MENYSLEIEKKIAKAGVEQATSLNLSSARLRTLPEGLFALTQLRVLNLSDNEITVLPESLFALTHLTVLNLSDNELTVLPESLSALTHLTVLNLSENYITALPEGLFALTQLIELNLSGNQLTALPESVSALTQLEALNLGYNQLTALPESLSALTQLTTLDLSCNQLTALPGSLFALTQLKELYLGGNQLTALPESLSALTQLTTLELIRNQLTALPESLSALTHLTELYLGDNKLTALPESFSALTQLKELDLGQNQLTAIPESFSALTHLTELFLPNNQLTVLPEGLSALTQLTRLDLDNNQLTAIPESFSALTQLKVLYLDNNQLMSLPESFSALTQLRNLDLSDNYITALPESLFALMQLRNLDLSGNQLTEPPQRTADEGIAAIRRWLEQEKQQGTVDNFETKVVLLGPPAVGKTSLRKKIENIHNALPTIEERTVGVDLYHWRFNINLKGQTHQAIAHVFDFAGQKVQYMMHQFFLTPDAFHILLSNGKEGDGELSYWISNICTMNKAPCLLPVFNQFGVNSPPTIPMLPKVHLLPLLPINLNAKDDDEMDELKGAIVQIKRLVKEHILHTSQPVLSAWRNVSHALSVLHNAYIDITEFRAICVFNKLEKTVYQDDLLKDLTKLGYVLHFEHVQFDKVFLDPNWLIKAIYTLFKPENKLIDTEGYFSAIALKNEWSKPDNDIGRPQYSEEEQQILFNLLLRGRFNICFAAHNGHDKYLVPQYLSKEPKLTAWNKHLEQSALASNRKIKYKRLHFDFKLLPEGFIAQLIVELQHLVCDEFNRQYAHWNTGMVLSFGSAMSLVQANETLAYGHHIAIEIQGPQQDLWGLENRIIGSIQKLSDIHYRDYLFSLYIPCTECLTQNNTGHKFRIDDQNSTCSYGHRRKTSSNTFESEAKMNNNVYNININSPYQGLLNLGSIQGNIGQIQSNLSTLSNDSKQLELVDALKKITEAIVNDDTLTTDNKNDAIATIKEVAEQAKLPKEKRAGFVNTLVQGLGKTMEVSKNLKSIWDTWHPAITSAFS